MSLPPRTLGTAFLWCHFWICAAAGTSQQRALHTRQLHSGRPGTPIVRSRRGPSVSLPLYVTTCLPLAPAVMNGGSHSPTAVHGAPSTPNGFSNGPATSCSAALSTQHLPPACGARQLSKLKRFLSTLQQFGSDISPEIGERVRMLVLGLVVSGLPPRGLSLIHI